MMLKYLWDCIKVPVYVIVGVVLLLLLIMWLHHFQ